MSAATSQTIVTAAHQQDFERDGVFILHEVIPQRYIDALRGDCDAAIALIDERMSREPAPATGISRPGSRYFIGNQHFGWPGMSAFLYSDLMAQIAQSLLGPNVYLFHEQWVVKAAEKGDAFSWHQDSGYVSFPHKPYLTCWCALDDVHLDNGTVFVLPQSRAGIHERVEHVRGNLNDLVGYHGDDPGDPVICKAGSIAVFSSLTFHRSGANKTPAPRRVYVAQYSAEPIIHPDDGRVTNLAIPLVQGGRKIRKVLTPLDL